MSNLKKHEKPRRSIHRVRRFVDEKENLSAEPPLTPKRTVNLLA
jgi:hypothetical protein